MKWTWIEDVTQLLFPPLCVCCEQRLVEGEEYICLSCFLKLPLFLHPVVHSKDNPLEEKLVGFFPFEKAMFLGYYEAENSIQSIVHSIKYRRNKSLAVYIGAFAAKRLSDSDFFATIDFLIPIPLHRKRLKQRTFNQSDKICEGISSATSIPILNTAFERIKNNRSQTNFTKTERAENVKNIFQFRSSVKDALYNKHLLIVDDVVTSGATIYSLILSIPKDLNVKISVFCIGNAR